MLTTQCSPGGLIRVAATTTCAIVVSWMVGEIHHPLPASADTGFDGARLLPCPYESNCVSSGFQEPPNRYVSPLKIVKGRDLAFNRAVRDLKDESIVDIIPREYYIHLTVPGTAVGSVDDVELQFRNEGVVQLRCQSRVTLPPPPFCLKKNCINGNMDQRQRLEKIATILGLPPVDQERMKSARWTPMFFNSDRVPDFDDDAYD